MSVPHAEAVDVSPTGVPHQPSPRGSDAPGVRGWKTDAALFAVCLFVYAYFFQGMGANQNAHFAAVRALIERGTFDITPYRLHNLDPFMTWDVSYVGTRTYSNKPPGLPLLAAPVYAVLAAGERAAGWNLSDHAVQHLNLYLLTIWASAVPAAGLAVAMRRHWLRVTRDPRTSLLLALGFAFGTLAFPYAGIMMNHDLVAACLFGAWVLLTRERPTLASDAAAGGLLGLGLVTDYLVGPVIPVLLLPLIRRRRWRGLTVVAAASAWGLVALLWYHHAHFGTATHTAYTDQQTFFSERRLFLNVFDWPELARLWWISFHPYRGLFYGCPVLLLSVLGLVLAPQRLEILRRNVVPLIVVVYFLLFNLCFNGWTGGWATGPRYMIAAIPFLYVLAAAEGLRRAPAIAVLLIALSVFNMLVTAGVRVQYPGFHSGSIPLEDPIGESFRRLTMGEVAKTPLSFNLGQLVGLPGPWSLAPAVLAVIGAFAVSWRLGRSPRPARP